VVTHLDVRLLGQAAPEGLLAVEGTSRVQDDHPGGVAGESEGLVEGRVVPAPGGDEPHDLPRDEGPVAGGAVADPTPEEAVLARDADGFEARPGGDDYGGGAVAPGGRNDAPAGARRRVRRLEAGDFGRLEAGPVTLSLLLGHGAQVVPGDAVREAGEVLHRGQVDQVAPGDGRLEDEGGVAIAGGEQPGGQAGQATPDDDDLEVLGVSARHRPRQSVGSRRP
jgi:hypothetical protein